MNFGTANIAYSPRIKTDIHGFTVLFDNMQNLKFKAQPTNAFFATVNQLFAGSSQLSTAAKCAVIKLLCRVKTTNRVWQ